jgi:release factor glutamine methyltransferase
VTLGEALRRAVPRLAGTGAAAITAEALLGHVLGLTRTQVLAQPGRPLAPGEAAAFEALVARAAEDEPLAYLTGRREFRGLTFAVDRRVLVPRPETEVLVEAALRGMQPAGGRVLDVGTGSGCIAVSLAVAHPGARVTALDISPGALEVARANAAAHGVGDRITFIVSDLLEALPAGNGFDLIAANLPYIDQDEVRRLPVARHEPALALDGGPGGLRVIERLLAQAPPRLAAGGRLLLEVGAGQAPAAAGLARAAFPGAGLKVHCDLAGIERVVEVGA